MSTELLEIPVIDMANFPAELKKLAAAATEFGCFRIVNHGMPATLPAEIKTVARSLFELPVEVKLRNINDKVINSGYVPLGKLARLVEAFGIYDVASPADVHSFCSDMQVSPSQREIISEYFANLHGVMIKIASFLAEILGLVGCSFHDWSCEAKISRYYCSVKEDIGDIVVPNHTDTGLLTLLQEDESVRGLEIMNANGNFVTVDPVPGTFLAIIGDVGKVWSNGRLANPKHRVVCKEALLRMSIILFMLSPKDEKIEPEAALIDADHPRLYQTFNYKDYSKIRSLSGVKTDVNLPLWKE